MKRIVYIYIYIHIYTVGMIDACLPSTIGEGDEADETVAVGSRPTFVSRQARRFKMESRAAWSGASSDGMIS
jgi:hypothetical protein